MEETTGKIGFTAVLPDQTEAICSAYHLSWLQKLSLALLGAVTVEQVADAIISEGLSALNAATGAICLLTDDGANLELVRTFGLSPHIARQYDRLPLDTPVPIADALRQGELILLTPADDDPHHPYRFGIEEAGSGQTALAAFPLKVENRVVGAIAITFTDRGPLSAADRACMETIAPMFALALERASKYEMERRAREAAEQQLAEELRASDDRTENFFGSLTDGFIALNQNWRVMYVNAIAATSVRLPREVLIGNVIWDLFPDVVDSDYYADCHQAMNERTPVHRDDFWPRYNIWFENHIFPIQNGIAIMFRDITERKQLEKRLREESESLETINDLGQRLSAELNLERLMQDATDAATKLVGAQFGAFFYNVVNPPEESYTLYTISGVPREKFSRFPMPRNTAMFAPTFAGEGTVRLDDVTQDPRYGKNAPFYGKPPGHLPVVSYLAVSVVSRSGEVLGGLFFGHEQPGIFTERHERIVEGLAAQAAIAIDNARLFQAERERSDQLGIAISEVHHRVKNSLQAVAALLEMQIPDDESVMPVEAARDSLSQIKTIALVHDLLAHDKPIGIVDAAKVLTNLAKLLSQGMRTDNQPLPSSGRCRVGGDAHKIGHLVGACGQRTADECRQAQRRADRERHWRSGGYRGEPYL
jgi:PAS domain S-box-containing protein